MNTLPRPEYPRPQFFRDSWMNLNGRWEFEFDFGNSGKDRELFNASSLSGEIIVPFCPESELSGIGHRDFIPAVWYRRSVVLTKEQAQSTVLLHFGAVDYHTEVFVNGKPAGTHDGGYSSFALDISSLVAPEENVITVYASDDLRSGRQPHGKQCGRFYSAGCDYTRTTGIWQTVWLEFAPKTYIQSYQAVTDPFNGTAALTLKIAGCTKGVTAAVTASFAGKETAAVRADAAALLPLTLTMSEIHPWGAGEPNLYDLELCLYKDGVLIDRVESYLGLRSIELKKGAICLNGKPLFQRLVLDQGYYPDGIYTAPTDEALKRDIELSMAAGFNGARLHQKVFEERFLYWADKLGYLVWGEQGSWGLDFSRPEGLACFLPEWMEVVARDFNHPAIVGWCPFNETWDIDGRRQIDSTIRTVYLTTKAMDPTRPVIDTSGNYHVETDIYDIHLYDQDVELFKSKLAPLAAGGAPFETFPERQTYGGQPWAISEYGGAWWNPNPESSNNWGYGDRPKSEDEVLARYKGLTLAMLENPYICFFCYTQLYDVEQEQNGVYTYHREKKFSDRIYEEIKAVNQTPAAIEKE